MSEHHPSLRPGFCVETYNSSGNQSGCVLQLCAASRSRRRLLEAISRECAIWCGNDVVHGEMLPGQLLDQRPGRAASAGSRASTCAARARTRAAPSAAPPATWRPGRARGPAGLMARVFVTRRLPGSALDRLGAEHEVEVWEERLPPPPGELSERAARSEGLLTLLTDTVDAELLAAAPAPAGDLELRRRRRQHRRRRRDRARHTRRQHARRAHREHGGPRGGADAGRLPPDRRGPGRWSGAASGSRGSRSCCSAGTCTARPWASWATAGSGVPWRGASRASARGSSTASRSDGVPLEQLLAESDFVTLHCPLTPETAAPDRRRARSSAMKDTAYLVNTARGPIVDSVALARALAEGAIAGAALDVTDPEPLPPRQPAGRRAQPRARPAHRLGHAPHAGGDGRHGGRQPAGRPARRADAALRRTRGLRNVYSPSTLMISRLLRRPSNSA